MAAQHRKRYFRKPICRPLIFWEKPAGCGRKQPKGAGMPGLRTVKIRQVLCWPQNGGALSKLALPVKMGVGSHLGSGRQYMPWIHIDDLCGIYLKALKDQTMQGSYNAVAPEHITNRQLVKAIAGVLHKPMWFPPVPAFALRLLFGEMATMLLTGSRVAADRIINAGYEFRYGTLDKALTHLFKS